MTATNATRAALNIEGIGSASFWPNVWAERAPLCGVVYDETTGQEYDVRKLRHGWNVNDDSGRNHSAMTLRGAIRRARRANTKGD